MKMFILRLGLILIIHMKKKSQALIDLLFFPIIQNASVSEKRGSITIMTKPRETFPVAFFLPISPLRARSNFRLSSIPETPMTIAPRS